MQYISTRGQMAPASFTEVLLDGLAPDGGLVVPTEIPQLPMDAIEELRSLTYPELATEIIGLYATDIARDDLADLTHAAYGEQFAAPEVVPLKWVDSATALVGLSEGPTMAFKDLAMQFLGQVVPFVLRNAGRTLNIVGATSGDTGSAAEYAFRGKENIAVFMLSPAGRMSDVQRAQMYSLADANIHNIAVEGVFDDCQNIVKSVMNDAAFKAKYSLGAVNSINFGRICAQVVYYVWAWLRATDTVVPQDRAGFRVNVAVPSGNFGNIYAGYLAKSMGLPINKLVLATNENNVLDEFFRTGVYAPRSGENTYATSSPSMDISKASNLERFVWQLLGAERFVEAWSALDREGRLDLSAEQPRLGNEFGFVSGTSTHADRLDSIREVLSESGIVIDPHTADGVTVVRKLREAGVLEDRAHGGVPTLIMETALPLKFGETVAEAIGKDAPDLGAKIAALLELPQHSTLVANDPACVRKIVEEFAVL